MYKFNKLTTSFIKIINVLAKGKTQGEYNIYMLVLDEEEPECFKHAQRLMKYAHKQLPTVDD